MDMKELRSKRDAIHGTIATAVGTHRGSRFDIESMVYVDATTADVIEEHIVCLHKEGIKRHVKANLGNDYMKHKALCRGGLNTFVETVCKLETVEEATRMFEGHEWIADYNARSY